LRGKIQIADDFDTLPDDLAEAFGMKPQSIGKLVEKHTWINIFSF